jgi:type II secretory pathway pseudopilin PulG
VGDPVRTAIVKAEYTEATRTFQNALESANNWQERLLAAEQLQKAVDKLSPESRMLLEALPPIVNKMVDAEVHTQAALASLQIEQFRRQNGRFPENLVEAGVAIEDPIIAARLDYKDGKVEVKK